MLPEEILLTALQDRYPCRELLIRQLAALYAPSLPSPSTLVVHGLQATGKSSILKDFLTARRISHAIVNSGECITGRHLLERTVSASLDAIEDTVDQRIDRSLYSRCQNISALAVHLQRLLESCDNFVLVFDGIDKQREAPPTLLAALARFGEIIPSLSVVLIVTYPRPRFLHAAGVPHIHFTPYTRDQTIQILAKSPPEIFLVPPSPSMEYTDDLAAEDNHWVWVRFLAAVWDSSGKGAARDLASFKAVAENLWDPFIQPVRDGTFGTRDFSRLIVSRRALLQSEDALVDSVIPKATGDTARTVKTVSHDLSYYSKYILCAAYLASYNPPRQDQLYFMKSTDKRRRKRGGATAARKNTPKNRKIPRHLLHPSPFPLDRLLAILHAILPHPLPHTADIDTQIATLASLRLLLRAGSGGGVDVLDAASRWRVNVSWEYVATVGRGLGFEVEEYLAGGGGV
ncbi:hypothetical protein M501DRAFT_931393 [Patellaria atrata CBS 101060]|uniref:Orc1-like AAA ATPase domain-containing protein n=1 Tax=Patellaria atrata CBS 101060 TaxID=1346257 RepID=A0A9P4VR04_9PEZI|nr:hypothetical protein M501DRAFT_931393 [Patellaria atrata CBS 101060]